MNTSEKQALCIHSYDDLVQTLNESREAHKNNTEFPTLDLTFVPRSLCEDPANGYLQVIPYVTFYTFDILSGKLEFLTYTRKEEEEATEEEVTDVKDLNDESTVGEPRLAGKSSIGFGGHIDLEEDLIYTDVTELSEDIEGMPATRALYKMTIKDIVDTCIEASIREIDEELAINLEDYEDYLDRGTNCFFKGGNDEVSQVHIGMTLQYALSKEKFEELKGNVKFNDSEISSISVLGINIDAIVESMDVSTAVRSVVENSLIKERNMEAWSCVIVDYIVRGIIHNLLKDVNYRDLIEVREAKLRLSEGSNKEES